MGSRKRIQGKARRSKAAEQNLAAVGSAAAATLPIGPQEQDDAEWWFDDDYIGCRHGQPRCPPPGHPCRSFLEQFQDRWGEEEVRRGPTAAWHALLSVHRERPNTLKDACHREMLKAIFLSNLTQGFLLFCRGGFRGGTKPHALAGAVMAIEDQEVHMGVREGISRDPDKVNFGRRDIIEGCDKSLVKFLKDRTPCKCMKDVYETMKSLPKTGICQYCAERKVRTALMFCSSCRVTQYCSKECQALHWPEHCDKCKKSKCKSSE